MSVCVYHWSSLLLHCIFLIDQHNFHGTYRIHIVMDLILPWTFSVIQHYCGVFIYKSIVLCNTSLFPLNICSVHILSHENCSLFYHKYLYYFSPWVTLCAYRLVVSICKFTFIYITAIFLLEIKFYINSYMMFL